MLAGDETFERELFARRAAILPGPELDLDDVIARAEPAKAPEHVRSAAWITMAAALFIMIRGSAFAMPSEGEATSQLMSVNEEGICSKQPMSEETACVDPSKMVCEVTFAACRP